MTAVAATAPLVRYSLVTAVAETTTSMKGFLLLRTPSLVREDDDSVSAVGLLPADWLVASMAG